MKVILWIPALFLGMLDFMLWNMLMSNDYGFRSLPTAVKENYATLKGDYHV